MRKDLGFTAIEVIVVIVVAAMIGAGTFLYFSKSPSTSTPAAQNDTTPSHYQSNADLDKATQDLDSTNVDSNLDAPLQQLDQQSSTF